MKQPAIDRLGDVVLWQSSEQSWQLRDLADAVLDERTFADFHEALQLALHLARLHDGTVWRRDHGARGLTQVHPPPRLLSHAEKRRAAR